MVIMKVVYWIRSLTELKLLFKRTKTPPQRQKQLVKLVLLEKQEDGYEQGRVLQIGIPNVVNFASNGMALIQPKMITKEWKETFFSEEAAAKAYTLLRQSFSGISWPVNAITFKSYIIVLGEMKKNLNIFQDEIQKTEEGAPMN